MTELLTLPPTDAEAESWGRAPVLHEGESIGGDLTVIEHLGGSRKVDIYLCRSRRLKRKVACKVLRPEHLHDERAVRALLREGEILERLDHPNVVRGYGAFLDPTPHLVMEHLQGQTLANALFRGNHDAFDLTDFVEIIIQVAEALSHIHARRFLHLDVKPSNIQYDDGHVTLFDFSVATEMSPQCELRHDAGTTEYMAPEQTFREPLGCYTDVFGLGVVFYRSLTGGRYPYMTATAVRHPDEEPEARLEYRPAPTRPSQVNPGVPEKLDDVVLTALSPEPRLRYQMPGDFATALRRVAPQRTHR